MMKLYAVRIFVDDWESACQFYEQKLGLTMEFKNDEFGWAELDIGGGTKFGLERVDQDAPEEDKVLIGRFVGVSLRVDDVQTTYQNLLQKGVEFTREPEVQEWGGVLVDLIDPCGNIITLMSES